MELIHTSPYFNISNFSSSKRPGIFNALESKKAKVAIIGLDEEGIIELAKFSDHFATIGFDNRREIVNRLNHQMASVSNSLENQETIFTSDSERLKEARFFVISIKSPLNEYYKPNLKSLTCAVRRVAKALKKRDHVIFKYTSFPGCIEEICLPILEMESKLRLNRDFTIGFSHQIESSENLANEAENILMSASNPELIEDYSEIFKRVEGRYIRPLANIRLAEIMSIISQNEDRQDSTSLKYA